MNDDNQIECDNCHWIGDPSELECSEEDANRNSADCKFNRCPSCQGDQFTHLDED